LGLFAIAVLTIASLILINPNPLQAWHMVYGDSSFYTKYIVAFRPMHEIELDHSLLQSIKTFTRMVTFPPPEYGGIRPSDPLATILYRIGLFVSAALGLLVLWKTWKMPLLNQIFALTSATTVLPMIAMDYTLNVLLVSMGFFLIFLVRDVAEGRIPMTLGQMLWFLLPCAWIMATETIGVLHGVFKCAAVLTLLGASIAIPLPSTIFGELTPEWKMAP